ncbi:NADH-quinone oxidoreductase subunit E [Rhizobiaceae bacterium n13]|uniref:NADH-quinone oxidoreductase subunit E n=1 Tax=Ferirhizobium litorale TaxID=2927786 RepID=A0AAE3QIZ7_9HYPH|nr:NADH-quinone oxidoreductase subunit E [Fererhizobium litorale]MDI7864358.1 NADH-quinone oxidoreductase subunit E [Fererhizobium litorale]MDI7924728.1 NADH-quinone oxidoreductase subunit E [Fererhizobium litorale]
MSVRRLAEDTVQPSTFAFTAENVAWAETTIKKYPEGRQQSAVIPLLMRAQEQDGWVTRAAIESIADMLDMPYIRVLEVATFYTQFQLKPVGTRAHVQVCGTTPCMLRGAEELMKVCKRKIAGEPFALNAEGTLSWEEVECQGACVNAPMVMIFKDSYEDLTPEQLEIIIDRFEAGDGANVRPGPQIDRVFSAPEGGLTSLTDAQPAPAKRVSAKPAASAEAAVSVPPSNAAKPKTAADETNPAVKSPANGKTALPADDPLAKPVKAAVAAASTKPSLDDKSRPKGVDRPETPDDLKLISGVGPKIEGILHEIGIFTYVQIATWKKAEREWVDGYLNFKGRIDREDWVKQAKALAKGGEAEYIKVFGKKPR